MFLILRLKMKFGHRLTFLNLYLLSGKKNAYLYNMYMWNIGIMYLILLLKMQFEHRLTFLNLYLLSEKKRFFGRRRQLLEQWPSQPLFCQLKPTAMGLRFTCIYYTIFFTTGWPFWCSVIRMSRAKKCPNSSGLALLTMKV